MNYLYHLYSEFLSKYNIGQNWCDLTFYVLPALINFAALLIVVLILVLAERKLLGWFTQRKGPNRVGFWGILQTLADAFKLLCKENITPNCADKFLYNLAPILMFTPVLILIGLIPFSSEYTFLNFKTNALIYLVFAGLPVLCILLGGLASNNKYSLLGAIRNTAQVLAYEIPMVFSVMSVMVLSSAMNLREITLSQSSTHGIFGWFWAPCFIGMVITFISMLAEMNRCPFDLPESESELICGYNTEYSGMRFALFYLSEYAILFTNALFISILFFGGYLSPFGKYISPMIFHGNLGEILLYFEQAFWILLKSFFVIFVVIWVRASLPRMASFDLLKFSWTILLPVSIFNFLLMILIKLIAGGMYA